jgi:hypothetical protein
MDEAVAQVLQYFNLVPRWIWVLFFAVIVVAFVGEMLHRRRAASAGRDFRADVLSIVAGLYPQPSRWPREIDTYLQLRLPAMQQVVDAFRPFVPQEKLMGYTRTWESYVRFCQDEVNDAKCDAASASPDRASEDPKKRFYALVTELLGYAD